MIRRPSITRVSALALLAALLTGCGSFWPWSSSAPKFAEPPPIAAPVAARIVWSLRLPGAGVGIAPAVSGDSVFAASTDGELVRLSARTGELRWRIKVGKRLSTGVGADGTLVAVATADGQVAAYDPDGKPLWRAPLGAEAVTVPAVGEGLVIVRASDNRVAAFDALTGRRRWSFQRQSPPLVLRQTAGLLIGADTVFVGLPGGRVAALALQTGALRWEAAVSQARGATEIERIADVVGAPTANGADVCAVSFQGRLACFEAGSGRSRWNRELSSSSGFDADASQLAVSDDRGQVHAFATGGASLWRQDKLAGRTLSAPSLLPGVVLIGDQQGFVHLLRRDDGAIAGRFATDGSGILARPVPAGRIAVVQTRAGAVYGIEIE